jgi:hypothetical protein
MLLAVADRAGVKEVDGLSLADYYRRGVAAELKAYLRGVENKNPAVAAACQERLDELLGRSENGGSDGTNRRPKSMSAPSAVSWRSARGLEKAKRAGPGRGNRKPFPPGGTGFSKAEIVKSAGLSSQAASRCERIAEAIR